MTETGIGTSVDSTLSTSSSPFVFAGGVGVGRTDCFGFEVDVCDEGTNITDGRRSGFGVGVGDAFTRADWAAAETAAASMRVEMRPSFIRANVIVAYLISDTEARLHGRKPTCQTNTSFIPAKMRTSAKTRLSISESKRSEPRVEPRTPPTTAATIQNVTIEGSTSTCL